MAQIFSRLIEKKIEKWLFKRKVIIIYGARQVGKTTLCKQLVKKHGGKYINSELPQYKQILQNHDIEAFAAECAGQKLVIIDEAQTVENIGLFLKIMADTYPKTQIIATGSSSFELANKISEPLTGRAITFKLYNLALNETGKTKANASASLENILIYGTYPEVFGKSATQATTLLSEISSNYLYKDILHFEQLKKPKLLEDLLLMLALQLGNEVNNHELAKALKTSVHTIDRYIDLLEKVFVIYRLRAFSRNLRKEISKTYKIYFYDLGMRNFIINNFNPLKLRTDVGALWENFCITEFIKKRDNTGLKTNRYFWRTYSQKEIDYIEEYDGLLHAYEFKYNASAKAKIPAEFLKEYSNTKFKLITPQNLDEFLK